MTRKNAKNGMWSFTLLRCPNSGGSKFHRSILIQEFPLALLLYQIPHFTSGCLPFCGGNFEVPLIPKYLIYLNSWKPDKTLIHSRELVQSKCLQNLTVRKMSGCGISSATKREYLNTYTYGSIFLDPMNIESVQGTKMYQGPCGGWSISISVGRGTYLKGGKPRPTVWAMRLLSFSRTILRLSTGQATQEFNGKLALNDSTSRFSVEIYIDLSR